MYNFKLINKTNNRIYKIHWFNPRLHKVKDSNIPNNIK